MGLQPEKPRSEDPLEEAILPAVPVNRIADQRMRKMGKMPANLMHPPGLGLDPDQGESRARVPSDGVGKLHPGDSLVPRYRRLSLAFGRPRSEQRMINHSALSHPSPRHRVIGLSNPPIPELGCEKCGGLRIQRVKQHAGGGPVEPVHRVDVTAQLIAQERQAVRRWTDPVPRVFRRMGMKARGLVDGDEALVPVEDPENAHDPGRPSAIAASVMAISANPAPLSPRVIQRGGCFSR